MAVNRTVLWEPDLLDALYRTNGDLQQRACMEQLLHLAHELLHLALWLLCSIGLSTAPL